ncbi:IclR family transcriptional regulator [Rhizobium halophytocola]|uniref:DNA-binding IclR family transcriptional regulator n=1 Tax=Rhizobium halophytocola TaxID=735519 RepID=A0ABS4DU84_9HYPH|nr:IclR family transcriptional regulator [Rhizobium halophytocola]MBP1849241.1 DNA-binding IclR family transcriptional regulator [Rhizobium halophytocola]
MNSEVKSAGRILDLIEYLAARREAVALAQIIRDLQLPKSSAHALIQTLAARGHLAQDDKGKYVLVEQSRHGFPFHRNEEPLVVTAMPVMEALRDQSEETVMLSTMNAYCEIRRLAKCVSRQPVHYNVSLDAAITPHCTATGRILLAYQPKEAVDAYFGRMQLLSYTRYTITDPDALRNVLKKARRDGYALNDQEFITGSTGIAAPIFDEKGAVVAALNLGTLTTRYLEKQDLLILMVRDAAHKVSKALGYAAG